MLALRLQRRKRHYLSARMTHRVSVYPCAVVMEPRLVTTIIPVFNRPAMLREAVASVIAQTYRPIEIVIVDDGSTDDTGQAAESLAQTHPEITVIHQDNAGAGQAREAARRVARGEYVQHLDSDDLLLPRKFELQVASLEEHPGCGVAYGWTRYRRLDGSCQATTWKRTGEPISTMFPAMLASRWWDTSTPLYHSTLIQRAGAWTDLRVEEDWEYDCRVAALGVSLAYVPEWASETRERTVTPDARPALRDRARAHALILEHAERAGIATTSSEMQHFARELFLLSRQCGAAGLLSQSAALFELARRASGTDSGRLQFRVYRAAARLIGWRLTGALAAWRDRWR